MQMQLENYKTTATAYEYNNSISSADGNVFLPCI